MTRLFTLLLSLMAVGSLSAQTTIERDALPDAGLSFNAFVVQEAVDPQASNTGNDVTWDFTDSLSGGQATSVEWVTPNNAEFPDANLSLQLGGDFTVFYGSDDDSLEQQGASAQGQNIAYTNGATYFQYPVDLSDSYDDPFALTAQGFTLDGDATTEYDGFGTLILPDGSYDDVFRVYSNQTFTSPLGSGTVNIYYWFETSTKRNLLTIVGIDAQPLLSQDLAVYKSDDATAADDKLDVASLNLFPNPTTGSTTLRYSLQASADARLSIRNVAGQEVRAEQLGTLQPGTQEANLDVSALTPGLYIVSLELDGQAAASRKLIVR